MIHNKHIGLTAVLVSFIASGCAKVVDQRTTGDQSAKGDASDVSSNEEEGLNIVGDGGLDKCFRLQAKSKGNIRFAIGFDFDALVSPTKGALILDRYESNNSAGSTVERKSQIVVKSNNSGPLTFLNGAKVYKVASGDHAGYLYATTTPANGETPVSFFFEHHTGTKQYRILESGTNNVLVGSEVMGGVWQTKTYLRLVARDVAKGVDGLLFKATAAGTKGDNCK